MHSKSDETRQSDRESHRRESKATRSLGHFGKTTECKETLGRLNEKQQCSTEAHNGKNTEPEKGRNTLQHKNACDLGEKVRRGEEAAPKGRRKLHQRERS